MRNQNQFAPLVSLKGGMPEPRSKRKSVFNQQYKGNMLGEMRREMKNLYPDHNKRTKITREMEGRLVKKVGKARGNTGMIQQGRDMQYGRMTPERLFTKHPGAFLRRYTIRAGQSMVQDSEAALGSGFNKAAGTKVGFHLAEIRGTQYSSLKTEHEKIIGDDGVARTRKGDLSVLLSDNRQMAEEGLRENVTIGPKMKGSFLPMVQAGSDQLTEPLNKHNVKRYRSGGKLNVENISQKKPIITTELTGCSIVRSKNALAHIRPKSSGSELQKSFRPQQSYGRNDYATATNAFVMMRRKSGGRVKLYYQTHHSGQPSRTGSRYLK